MSRDFRIIKKTDGKERYEDLNKDFSVYNSDELDRIMKRYFYNRCHFGQLKLFYSELEFMTLIEKQIDVNECLFVYVGSGSGYRLKELFVKYYYPGTHWLLYDPRPFKIEEDEQIKIRTGDRGFFRDETVAEVLEIANGRKIIFICDMRDDIGDAEIYDDIISQQRWGVQMSAEFMLLKFRFPFNDFSYVKNEYDDIREHIVYKRDDKNGGILYLNGMILTQLYSPPRSTETRLFVAKMKYINGTSDKYQMSYYDPLEYEQLLSNFNVNVRMSKFSYEDSDKLHIYIPGQKMTYTAASEYLIMEKYLKHNKREYNYVEIINEILRVYAFLQDVYNTNIIFCDVHYNDYTKNKIREYNMSKYPIVQEQLNNLIKFPKIDKDIKLLYLRSLLRQKSIPKIFRQYIEKNMI